jgi:cobalt-zinc-cadmium resistance protein CzcA
MKIWWLSGWLLLSSFCGLQAQSRVDLPSALQRVRTQHVQLQAQRVYLQQQAALIDAAKGHPATNFGYGVEEWGAAGSGIHSLYLNQSFNLPAVAQRRAALQEALAAAGSSELLALERQLERSVAQQYQQILFYKSQSQLNTQLIALYDSIAVIAERRATVGETGRLPLLSTQTAQQQLILQQFQSQQLLQASLVELQQLLYDSTVVAVADSALTAPLVNQRTLENTQHPLLLQLEQQKTVLQQQAQVLHSQWLPQLTIGAQVQVVEGLFPNGAAQLGLSVPLFRRGLKAQLRGNELGQQQVSVQVAGLLQQIELEEKKAWQQVLALQQQVRYLEREVLPTLLLQQQLLRRAYAVGELNYLNVLQSLQQVFQARQQYLNLLLELNLQWIDYQYWSS